MPDLSPITVAFLLFPNVTQLDFTGPAQVLSRMGNTTLQLVARTREPVSTDAGFAITPTHTLAEVSEATILCVPGGLGVTDALEDPELRRKPRARWRKVWRHRRRSTPTGSRRSRRRSPTAPSPSCRPRSQTGCWR